MSRVLDRDALDAAAARMLGGARIDAAALLARSAVRARRRRRRRVAVTGVLVAAVVVLLFAGNAVPGLAPPRPAPAVSPDAPGAVPDAVRVPPPWTPSATERPLARVAYAVLDTRHDEPGGSGHPVWLVAPDGGGYRWLPAADPYRVAVSADGTLVSWVEQPADDGGALGQRADVVRILDVPAGVVRSVRMGGTYGRGFAVAGAAFAATGDALLIWGSDRGSVRDQVALVAHDINAGAERPGLRSVSNVDGVPSAGLVPVEGGGRPIRGLAPAAPVGDADLRPGIPGPVTQPPLVAPGGGLQYAVAGRQFNQAGDRELYRYELQLRKPGAAGGSKLADLGTGTAAIGLGVGGGPVLVSRWTTTTVSDRGAGSGPGEVLRVEGNRKVRTLTRTEGGARVIAAASAVAGPGRSAAAPGERPRVLQATWYGWEIRRGAGWVRDLPWQVHAYGGLAVAALLLGAARRRGPGRGTRAVTVVAAGVAVVVVTGSAAVVVAGALIDAPAASPTGAAPATPVMPAVLRDRHRAPARAFDVTGQPATRRVSAVFTATVAGREGSYALDAGTGRIVTLDGLPGLQPVKERVTWMVSPDGRYVASEAGVVDLETARVRVLSRYLLANGAVLDDGGVVGVIPDGGLVHTSAQGDSRDIPFPFPGQPRVPGTTVVARKGTQVLLQSPPAAGNAPRKYTVLDLATREFTPVESDLLDRAPLPPLVTADGRVAATALDTPVRVVEVTEGNKTVAVGPSGDLGPSGSGEPIAVLRSPDDGGGSLQLVTAVRLVPTAMGPAAEVVAAARTTDVTEPWWTVLADPDTRDLAGEALIPGIAALLLAGTAVVRTRRARRAEEE